MKKYENQTFDTERALYALRSGLVSNCSFQGPADGESALKECENITVENCLFGLRYPLWHLNGGRIENSRFTPDCRAALWYDSNAELNNCVLNGIKAVRECDDTRIKNCAIHSPEFGWFCRKLEMTDTVLESEYPFLKSESIKINGLKMKAKYSFQYVKNITVRNSVLDTKDAFWHAQNAIIEDCVITGEYLGWYSKNLRFVRCKITGTQPLCYAETLVLQDCEMIGTDLAFEYSAVQAKINGSVLSVKNPKSGRIEADEIHHIILDENKLPGSSCRIISRARPAA